jgi:hypothetical protein
MVPVMKPTIALLLSAVTVALAAPREKNPARPGLAQVHTVYLLSMTNGMDQYLANRLTGSGVFQVVTDPKKADAIFTDHLGEAFESQEAEWFPGPAAPAATAEPLTPATPQPAAPAATAESLAPATPQPAAPPENAETAPVPAPQTAVSPKPAAQESEAPKPAETMGGLKGDSGTRPSSFRRARGTIFLVDPHTRLVLWSIYAQPKDASGAELDRTAARIADRIKADLKSR